MCAATAECLQLRATAFLVDTCTPSHRCIKLGSLPTSGKVGNPTQSARAVSAPGGGPCCNHLNGTALSTAHHCSTPGTNNMDHGYAESALVSRSQPCCSTRLTVNIPCKRYAPANTEAQALLCVSSGSTLQEASQDLTDSCCEQNSSSAALWFAKTLTAY